VTSLNDALGAIPTAVLAQAQANDMTLQGSLSLAGSVVWNYTTLMEGSRKRDRSEAISKQELIDRGCLFIHYTSGHHPNY
jgi:hypothetical protein